MKARLFAAAALAPLALSAPAWAQTTITGNRTTPVQTSTVNNGQPADVVIDTGATVAVPTANTAAVTIDSNNTVTNSGAITYTDLNDVTGVLIRGGFTGGLTNNGSITLLEDFTPTDADSDGDLDGPFTQGARRYAVRLLGPGTFTGSILHGGTALISVEGADSSGISLESRLGGTVTSLGTILMVGDRTRAFANTGAVDGDVRLLGTISTQGANSIAADVAAPIGGTLVLQGTITSTGFRYTTRPVLPSDRAILDADDLLIGGPTVRVAADVARGVLVDTPSTDTSTTDTDEDDDGIPDANETTGILRSLGSAPVIEVGAVGAPVTLGAVGTGDNAYGMIVRGTVSGEGTFDNISATGIRLGLGTAGAGAVTVENGLSLTLGSSVRGTAFVADAAAVQVNAGASVPTIANGGDIISNSVSDTATRSTGIEIAAGGTVNTIRNENVVQAQVFGEQGTATAIQDRSGTLALVENRGRITALVTATDDSTDTDDPNSDPSDEVITGRAVALDVSANTTGVTFRQSGRTDTDADTVDTDGDGVDDADEPSTFGELRFGSGNDTLDALNGVIVGDMAFGAGADRLNVAGGATLTGAVSDSDGQLAVDVQNGSLTLTNTQSVNVTSVNVGGDGAITFTADPDAGGAGRLQASGAVTLANGSSVGLRLAGLQRGQAQYAVLQGASLSVGQLDNSLLGQTPFLYVITPNVDQAANTLLITVRPRTVDELGFNRSEAQAYEGVFNSLDLSPRIEQAVLGQTTQQGLINLYDQLLPDHSGGGLLSLSAVNDAISNVLDSRTDPRGRAGPNGAWAQEVFFNIRHDRDQALGFESQGFGFTGGFEGIGPDNGAFGLTTSFITADFEDTNAAVGEQISLSMFELGGYWRRQWGRFRLDARAAAGVVLFDSDRRFVSPVDNLALVSTAEWTGYSATGHLGASYEVGSRFYARPFVALDAVYLNEGEYAESGGGTGFDLEVDSRTGTHVTATGGLTVGARFGRETWWGPEATVGYRARVAGDPGSTTARFRGSTGQPFTLSAEDVDGGGLQIRLAMRAGSQRGYVALEAGGEVDDAYERYDIRIVVRMFF